MTNMEMDFGFAAAEELSQLMTRFVQEYSQKPPEQADSDWLKGQLLKELSGLTESAANALSLKATDTICTYSKNLESLMEAKARGETTQEWLAGQAAVSGKLPEEIAPKELRMVLEEAVLSGVQDATNTAGYALAEKIVTNVPPEVTKMVTAALSSGDNHGLKTAVAGALQVAAEKNQIEQLPADVPMQLTANLACTAIENTRVLADVAGGILTTGEGLEQIGGHIAVMQYDLGFGEAGRVIGRELVMQIPVVGPVLSEVGGMIGYMAGTKIGAKVRQAAGKVSAMAQKAMKRVQEAANKAVQKVKSGIKNLLDELLN